MSEQSVLEAVKGIESAKADAEIRVIRRMEISSAIQQGDLYIHRVESKHPRGKCVGEASVQVALGTGNGARHMACGECVTVFEGRKLPPGVGIPNVDDKELCGPVIVAEKPWSLKHPEHAHFELPEGTYQVTYQYDPKTMRRVQD